MLLGQYNGQVMLDQYCGQVMLGQYYSPPTNAFGAAYGALSSKKLPNIDNDRPPAVLPEDWLILVISEEKTINLLHAFILEITKRLIEHNSYNGYKTVG